MKTCKVHCIYEFGEFKTYCGLDIHNVLSTINEKDVTCKNCLRLMKFEKKSKVKKHKEEKICKPKFKNGDIVEIINSERDDFGEKFEIQNSKYLKSRRIWKYHGNNFKINAYEHELNIAPAYKNIKEKVEKKEKSKEDKIDMDVLRVCSGASQCTDTTCCHYKPHKILSATCLSSHCNSSKYLGEVDVACVPVKIEDMPKGSINIDINAETKTYEETETKNQTMLEVTPIVRKSECKQWQKLKELSKLLEKEYIELTIEKNDHYNWECSLTLFDCNDGDDYEFYFEVKTLLELLKKLRKKVRKKYE